VLRTEAPAKVNLLLRVLAREESGYHQIETVFALLSLADSVRLEVDPSGEPGVALDVEGAAGGPAPDLGPAADNLVLRAAEAWAAAAGVRGAWRFRLLKRVPAGAGLGGGSSDAAAALRLLQAAYGEPLDDETLLAIGGALGADVPFFVSGAAWALAWGRGDRLHPLAGTPPFHAVLALPPRHIGTAGAYRALAARRGGRPAGPALLRAQDLTSPERLCALVANDFEGAVFDLAPELALLRNALLDAGAAAAALSGSGAALFGLFHDAATAGEAATALADVHPEVRFETVGFRTAAPEVIEAT